MLSQSSYPAAYVAASRAAVRDHLDAYDALPLSAADRAAFEPGYLRQLVLALDTYALHRSRGQEGKDGNPLNEVRTICGTLMRGESCLRADSTIRYDPAKAVLGTRIGDPIPWTTEGIGRLCHAFLDEIGKKYP